MRDRQADNNIVYEDPREDLRRRKAERIRRRAVKLIFTIYWLMIFEGALRKWGLNSIEKYIFFIKDPFVIYLYWLLFINRMWPKRIFPFTMAFFGIFTILAAFGVFITGYPVEVMIYGWKMYALYLPLPFIIGAVMNGEDLKRIVRHTLIVAMPYSLLIFAQFTSPPTAFVNKTVSDVVYTETGEAGGTIARVTGTFTFFHGEQLFAASLVVFLLISWLMKKENKPVSGIFLCVATAAVLVILGLDFTRLTYILAGLVMLSAILSTFILKKGTLNLKVVIVPVLIAIIGLFAISYFFPKATDIRESRAFNPGSDSAKRVRDIFNDYKRVLGRTPILGYGIGVSGRGRQSLSDMAEKDVRTASAGEEEWPRIIYEIGPFLGIMFIVYRLMFARRLFLNAVRATRRSLNPFPLLLVGFIGIIIAVWYVCHIGPVNAYGWIFAGFCVAANRLDSPSESGGRWLSIQD